MLFILIDLVASIWGYSIHILFNSGQVLLALVDISEFLNVESNPFFLILDNVSQEKIGLEIGLNENEGSLRDFDFCFFYQYFLYVIINILKFLLFLIVDYVWDKNKFTGVKGSIRGRFVSDSIHENLYYSIYYILFIYLLGHRKFFPSFWLLYHTISYLFYLDEDLIISLPH